MESTLYSIGYGNKTIAEFEQELYSFGITYLVDIRTKPYSQWDPDFNQNLLQAFLAQVNIKYVYMGNELGGMLQRPFLLHIDYAKMSGRRVFYSRAETLNCCQSKRYKITSFVRRGKCAPT